MSEPLICPSCARTFPLEERFCPECRMPLTYGGVAAEQPVTASRERARKIKPQCAEGDLVRVAGARHQAEAEFLQGMLLEEGVPSVLRRARGFDVPDFLAAGPRDVMVPASGAETAREVLLEAEIVPAATPGAGTGAGGSPARLLAAVIALVAVLAVAAFVVTELMGR